MKQTINAKRFVPAMEQLQKQFSCMLLSIEVDRPLMYSFFVLPKHILQVKLVHDDNETEIPSLTHHFPNAVIYERELSKFKHFKFSNQLDFTQMLLAEDDEKAVEQKHNDLKSTLASADQQIDYSLFSNHNYWITYPSEDNQEAFRFQFLIDRNKINAVTLRMGFSYYPIEQTIINNSIQDNFQTIEKLCGLCSIAHHLAYSLGIEDALQIEVPRRASWIRVLLAELERAQNHLLWIGFTMQTLGLSHLLHEWWKVRQKIIEYLEKYSKRKLTFSTVVIGGVSQNITPTKSDILEFENILEELDKLKNKIENHQLVVQIRGVGILSQGNAKNTGAVGPISRASGVSFDVRKNIPYAAYGEIPFETKILYDGDMYDNVMIRILESIESLRICSHVLKNLPTGDIQIPFDLDNIRGHAFSHVEAPSGHLYYSMLFVLQEFQDVKIRTPTMANIPSLLYRLKGSDSKFISLILRGIEMGIDPMEKVTFVDKQSHTVNIMRGSEFRSLSTKSIQSGNTLNLFSG
ncbi:MAG: NADH-quinone oxidoreductase subunit D-related protein [Candidatus Kariarchaeaceae archaeon]